MTELPAKPPSTSSIFDLIQLAKSKPLRWLVRDVLLEEGVHILHGHEETLKTMLTLQLLESLSIGTPFLLREVEGGLRTGIAELEMKSRIFGDRLLKFFPGELPDIRVLPDDLRRKVLVGSTPAERIKVIADW